MCLIPMFQQMSRWAHPRMTQRSQEYTKSRPRRAQLLNSCHLQNATHEHKLCRLTWTHPQKGPVMMKGGLSKQKKTLLARHRQTRMKRLMKGKRCNRVENPGTMGSAVLVPTLQNPWLRALARKA